MNDEKYIAINEIKWMFDNSKIIHFLAIQNVGYEIQLVNFENIAIEFNKINGCLIAME